MRLDADGSPNYTTTAPGSRFVWNTGATLTVNTPGSYTATYTDPNSSCTTASATVVVNEPLPVELREFLAAAGGPAAVRLAWSTASERNSAYFAIERSLDGEGFTALGQVPSAGNSQAVRSYGFRDGQLPAGVRLLYYRLRQVDVDGTVAFSPVRTVALAGPTATPGLLVFPNPTPGAATFTGLMPGATLHVFDALGREAATATADATGKAWLRAGLPGGVYVVRSGLLTTRLGGVAGPRRRDAP